MTKKSIQFVISAPIHNSQVSKNRILPFIEAGLSWDYSVQLVSPDKKKLELSSNSFSHKLLNFNYKPKEKINNFLYRVIYEFNYIFRLAILAKSSRSDISVLSIPSPILLFFSFLFDKHNLVIDLRDLTWEYLPNSNIFWRTLKKLSRIGSGFFLKRAKIILVTNSAEKKYILENYSFDKEIIKISNGISKKQFDLISNCSNSSDIPSVGYIGNIGLGQKIQYLIHAAEMMPNVVFKIVGDGGDFDNVKALIEAKKLKNVRLYGRVDWDTIPEIYKEINILYTQLIEDFNYGLPSKLYEYLATGKCILYGGSGVAKDFLNDFNNCHIVKPSCSESIRRKLNEIIDMKLYLQQNTYNQERIKKYYLREEQTKKFYEFLEN